MKCYDLPITWNFCEIKWNHHHCTTDNHAIQHSRCVQVVNVWSKQNHQPADGLWNSQKDQWNLASKVICNQTENHIANESADIPKRHNLIEKRKKEWKNPHEMSKLRQIKWNIIINWSFELCEWPYPWHFFDCYFARLQWSCIGHKNGTRCARPTDTYSTCCNQ